VASVPSAGNMDNRQAVPVAGGGKRVGLAILWVLAILIFGVGDVLTTAATLGLGGAEGNVMAATLMQVTGGSLWAFTLTKGVLLSGLLLLSYLKLGTYAWTIPAALTGTGTYLLLHNIATLMILL
jgi:hypothetical protein